ncbi:MAG: TetR/AcrR family transcriptional regulator [Pseudomonadota bacterium]
MKQAKSAVTKLPQKRKSAKKPKRAPKTGQMERTRESILNATVELLGEVMYGRLTIDHISERSGASRSTIYRHWRSLPELAAEAFDRIIDPDPDLPPVDDLRTQLIIVFSELPKNLERSHWGKLLPSLVCASSEAGDCSGLLQQISDRRRYATRKMLQRGIDKGYLKPETNIEWVIDLICSTYYVRHLITGTSMKEEGHLEWIIDSVLSQIRTEANSNIKPKRKAKA